MKSLPNSGITLLLAAALLALPSLGAGAENQTNREQPNGTVKKAVAVSTDNQNQEQTQQRILELERRLAELAGLLQALQQQSAEQQEGKSHSNGRLVRASIEEVNDAQQRVALLTQRLETLENSPGAAGNPATSETPAEGIIDLEDKLGELEQSVENQGSGKRAAAYTEDMHHYADKDVGYGAESSFLTWHGYLNFEFDKGQGTHSNFDNHEFYLSARAHVSERVSVTAEFEYEHTPEKLILPIQAFADLKINKYLNFRAGQFFTPMGIPRSYNLRGNRNRMVRQVALTHDIMFENWSIIGIDFFGQLPQGFFYDFALGNGMPNTLATGDSFFDADQTLQDHTEDNNGNKAIHSRFGYQSKNIFGGNLNLAISFGTQKYDPLETLAMVNTGADLRFLHRSGWRVQTEFMRRHGDDNPVDLLNGVSAHAQGFYFQVSKRFVIEKEWAQYIEPVVQFDWIDLNRNVDDNRDLRTTAIGFVFSPAEHYLAKFEYDITKEKYGLPINNNKFWAAIVVEF